MSVLMLDGERRRRNFMEQKESRRRSAKSIPQHSLIHPMMMADIGCRGGAMEHISAAPPKTNVKVRTPCTSFAPPCSCNHGCYFNRQNWMLALTRALEQTILCRPSCNPYL